jgi:hypothetical protein
MQLERYCHYRHSTDDTRLVGGKRVEDTDTWYRSGCLVIRRLYLDTDTLIWYKCGHSLTWGPQPLLEVPRDQPTTISEPEPQRGLQTCCFRRCLPYSKTSTQINSARSRNNPREQQSEIPTGTCMEKLDCSEMKKELTRKHTSRFRRWKREINKDWSDSEPNKTKRTFEGNVHFEESELWRVSSSGIWRHVVCWVSTDDSEEYFASIFRCHGVISQKMILFITTAVKTSDLTKWTLFSYRHWWGYTLWWWRSK